jgi:aconitate hydratase
LLIDEKTIEFLHETGRAKHHVQLVETYAKTNTLFRDSKAPQPKYTKTFQLDLSTISPCIAGPKRPQDRIKLDGITQASKLPTSHSPLPVSHSVVIASITSCTNTSNPRLMLTAGLLAKKAVEKRLAVPPYVKTSLGPGSRVVTEYLQKASLMAPLEKLGFHVVGYGCLTCIGNSGPLPEPIAKEITDKNLDVSAVLSGNRNFEGRVNPLVKSNYLASPPLVVAYALAGTTAINLMSDPIGTNSNGKPVYLKDVWPSDEEIDAVEKTAVDSAMYRSLYDGIDRINEKWNEIPTTKSQLFDWGRSSTYIQEPPFLSDVRLEPSSVKPIECARVLAFLGDSTTTDHISPAGSIKPDSPAGKYLVEQGVKPSDFNSYGARRGNDRVMCRGTFANIRIKNLLVPGIEGGITKHLPSGDVLPIYDAAMRYQKDRTPLIILAGAEYGTGSSRDWAAKGTALLGVRAVIAKSFERIHRGNLVGMGVLPLEFADGASSQSLNLDGTETFTIPEISETFTPGGLIEIRAEKEVQPNLFAETAFCVRVRIDTPVELEYYLGGGILPTVLRKLKS